MNPIPLHGAPCTVCDHVGGVLIVGDRVEHPGWVCLLEAGLSLATNARVPGVETAHAAGTSRYNLRSLERRRRKFARRVLIDGRWVAAHLPPGMHGQRNTRQEHGCECEPCVKAVARYRAASSVKRRGKAA